MSTSGSMLASQKPTGTSEESPPIRKVLVFVIVAMALLMTTIDATIVATALHTLQQDLHTSIIWAGWTLTAYSFGFVIMLPVSGQLSQRYGNRRVFVVSVASFTVASLCCGLASNIYLLIALRVVQAVGGAGITPSVTGIIVNHFGHSRDRAVSLFGSIFPLGAMIGPIFGGLFVTYWTWRGIFFINVPLGIAAVLLSLRYIPKDSPLTENASSHIDIKGILFMATGILAGMFAASYIGEQNGNPFSKLFIGLVFVATVAIFAFFRHIKKEKDPLIKPRLIYGRGFSAVNLINIIFSGMTIGIISLVPLYATNRYGINPLNSGLILVSEGIAAVTLSTIATFMLRRTGYRAPLYVGCSFLIIGMILLIVTPIAGLSPFLWLAMSTFLIGVGVGTINPSCRNAGLQLAPEQSSTIAALRSMALQLGAIITIAIATAVLTGGNGASHLHAMINLAVAAVFVLSLPLISCIPEHKGSW